jgi:cGMP-dependent protein kinase
LEAQLRLREQEILELRSHLDKFQSVFPYHIKNNQLRPRKTRAQGISAEPQSHSTIQELSEQNFPAFDKNDR